MSLVGAARYFAEYVGETGEDELGPVIDELGPRAEEVIVTTAERLQQRVARKGARRGVRKLWWRR